MPRSHLEPPDLAPVERRRSDRAESWTARLLEAPLGPWPWGIALGIAAYGFAQIVRSLGRKIEERLQLG